MPIAWALGLELVHIRYSEESGRDSFAGSPNLSPLYFIELCILVGRLRCDESRLKKINFPVPFLDGNNFSI